MEARQLEKDERIFCDKCNWVILPGESIYIIEEPINLFCKKCATSARMEDLEGNHA